jgi:predicted nucleotidyltransferase
MYRSYISRMVSTAPPVEQITRTIVEQFQPRRVVLFGSHARGDARPDSDLDLMVEMESALPRGPRTVEILKAFGIRPWALDLVVYTPQEVMTLRGVPGSLLASIEAEGRTLYERR